MPLTKDLKIPLYLQPDVKDLKAAKIYGFVNLSLLQELSYFVFKSTRTGKEQPAFLDISNSLKEYRYMVIRRLNQAEYKVSA